MVRAPFWVDTVCTTLNLAAPSSLITVIVPSPAEANARSRSASNPVASHPSPMGRHGLHDAELGGAVFLDYRDRTVSRGGKRQVPIGIESGGIASVSDGETR